MDTLIFRERLWPRATNLLLGALSGAVVGALVWPFHAAAGYVTAALAALSIVAALLVTAPRVAVDLGEAGEGPRLDAGQAHIGVEHLGEVEVLDAAGLREAMGPGADPRAYVCHRPWISSGLRVTVVDPRDPVPYWLVASRRPDALAEALGRAAQAAHSEQTSWPPSS